ncbi:MAG: peptidylprolyl isomerase [Methanosarcinaceae archaeon]|nr:peptidylprolyl isomerase [Methanosarcinaceae archaeon]
MFKGKLDKISNKSLTNKILILIAVITFAIFVSGCIEEKPVVENGDTIKVEYTGKYTNGTVFDTSEGREPLEFVAGAGQMIKGFDNAVIGMKEGEKKTVTIPPEEAYGERNETMILDIPMETVKNNLGSVPKIGDGLQFGYFTGYVIEVSDEKITLALNNRLAGETLTFDIEVVEIKKTETDELNESNEEENEK